MRLRTHARILLPLPVLLLALSLHADESDPPDPELVDTVLENAFQGASLNPRFVECIATAKQEREDCYIAIPALCGYYTNLDNDEFLWDSDDIALYWACAEARAAMCSQTYLDRFHECDRLYPSVYNP